MQPKTELPPLPGQEIDADTFRRVWERVMPDQSLSPLAVVPDSAQPATPSPPPEEAAGRKLPPVPRCSDQPELPPVPPCTDNCPACPQCPACPPCSAGYRSGEEDSPAPQVCFGAASGDETGRLEELMTLARAGAAAGHALARRASGSCARSMSELAADHRLAFRRLSAAYFLITGRRYRPSCPSQALPTALPLALRQQFQWEQRWEQANRLGAAESSDPCLKELYEELAQEGALHAGAIRSLLEQMT